LGHGWIHLLVDDLLNGSGVVFAILLQVFQHLSGHLRAEFHSRQLLLQPGGLIRAQFISVKKDIQQIAVLEEDPVQDRYDFALDEVGV
jgi:hypothetical protein